MFRKCEKCGAELKIIDTVVYANGHDLCTRCLASQGSLAATGALWIDRCVKCGVDLESSGSLTLIGDRLCQACQEAEALEMFMPDKCEKCGSRLKGSVGTLFLNRKLCFTCQASELGGVQAHSFYHIPEPLNLVIKEAEFHRDSLLNLGPEISIDVPTIANYTLGILGTDHNSPIYLHGVLHDVGRIQESLLGLTPAGPLTIPGIAETLASANLQMADAFSSLLSVVPSLGPLSPHIKHGWLKPLSVVEPFEIPKSVSSMVSVITGVSLAAESQFMAFSPLRLAGAVGVTESLANPSLVSLNDMAVSYCSLWSSLKTKPDNLLRANAVLVELPVTELYLAGYLARLVAGPDETIAEEQAEKRKNIAPRASMREKLRLLGEHFVEVYDGAVEAFMGDNVDKRRHVCVSLRELITHAIHKLAPNDQVSGWTTEPKYFQKGKPTRQARLLYICRKIDDGSFSNFVKSDVESSLKFINLLQEGTHSLSPPFGEAQVCALLNRAESLISFLIDASSS